MSTVTVWAGNAVRVGQDQVCRCPASVVMVNSQVSSGMRGVGPAESTGKSSVRYCPGGSDGSDRPRPVKPGETIDMPSVCNPGRRVTRDPGETSRDIVECPATATVA